MNERIARNDKKSVLFPKVSECQHFHYPDVHFNALSIALIGRTHGNDTDVCCRVKCDQKTEWTIRRSAPELVRLDTLLHKCVFGRDFSRLKPIKDLNLNSNSFQFVDQYVNRLNELLSSEVSPSHLNCVLVLNWFECDNNGLHTISKESEVNRRGIGAAFVVKRYSREAPEPEMDAKSELLLSLEIGELISIIEFNSVIEEKSDTNDRNGRHDDSLATSGRRFWSKGKKGIQVGLFPSECVQMIGQNLSNNVFNALNERNFILKTLKENDTNGDDIHTDDKCTTSPSVLRKDVKNGKIAAFFQKLVSHERHTSDDTERNGRKVSVTGHQMAVFGSDLCEQLFHSSDAIPSVVSVCTRFIESHGLVDGIYRLSGAVSNIAKLRQMFDRALVPELAADQHVLADVHCVASCMKLFFRLLPNPLLTFQAYDGFVASIRQTTDPELRLRTMRSLVSRLPPPHRRTLRALMRHLSRVSKAAHLTAMTAKNLAIVWAPNLLRSRDIDNRSVIGDLAALQNIGVQAVVTEFLIQNCHEIFDDTQHTTQLLDDSYCDRKQQKTAKHDTDVNCRPISRTLSTDVTPMKMEVLTTSRSLDSFFGGGVSALAINFTKIQTLFDLNKFLPHFDDTNDESTALWTTTNQLECRPLVTTECVSQTTVAVMDNRRQIRCDSTTIRQNNSNNWTTTGLTSRERIERFKDQRRQQLRQQFGANATPKPMPTPRKSVMPYKLRQIGPKVDTRRPQTTPIPTPRRRNSSCDVSPLTATTTATTGTTATITITPLRTSSRLLRNNWNRKATQMFESNKK